MANHQIDFLFDPKNPLTKNHTVFGFQIKMITPQLRFWLLKSTKKKQWLLTTIIIFFDLDINKLISKKKIQ